MRRAALALCAAAALLPLGASAGAQTPQDALAGAYFWKYTTLGKIEKLDNLALARVITRIEGELQKTVVLLQRYPFGWQMIAMNGPSIEPCQLKARGADANAIAYFSSTFGLAPNKSDDCASAPVDVGPGSDVTAIRALLAKKNLFIPSVHVVQGWALGNWYGAGGGQELYKKSNGTWSRVAGGGGAFDAGLLEQKGVPPAIARQLSPG